MPADTLSINRRISGDRMAAILVMSLSSDASARVLKHFSEDEVEALTLQIANMAKVSTEERDQVLDTFYQRCLAQQGLQSGGFKAARDLLERALGADKARTIMERLTSTVQVPPLGFLRDADLKQVAAVLTNEHPQTIAIVLANISPKNGADILSSLSPEIAVEVAMRLAIMDRTMPDVIYSIERVLEKKLSSSLSHRVEDTSGGIKTLVDILNNADRSTEKHILEDFEASNPELAEEVKKRMFLFEDIVTLDDRAVQLVMQDVDTKELALALKGTAAEVRAKVLRNLSERAGEMLEEEIEYLGPVRLKQVEEAQQGVVSIIRKLEEAGQIIIARGGEDEIIQ